MQIRWIQAVARSAAALIAASTLACASTAALPSGADSSGGQAETSSGQARSGQTGTNHAGLVISAEAAARADELLAASATIEAALTERLITGADRMHIELYGLEHRVKSRASLERKIQTAMLSSGSPAKDIQIDDVVRYTALVHDEPPGHYDEVVAEILRRADERGLTVVEVKNYWPVGDTYSGINCVLSTPEGLNWELQFHTIGSLAATDEGHPLYEEFRLPDTPVRRKRKIFDQLSDRWSWVAVPQGVLVEDSLHPKEEIILRQRP